MVMVECKTADGNMQDFFRPRFRNRSLSYGPHSVGHRKSHVQPNLGRRGRGVHLTHGSRGE